MQWSIFRKREVQPPPGNLLSIVNPELVALFGGYSLDGDVTVSELSTLGNSAFYRAIMLISGTLGQLKLNTFTDDKDGQPKKVGSIFDDPDSINLGGRQTPFEWKQTLFIHRILYGSAFCQKIKTSAGALVRLPLIHPSNVQIEEPTPQEYKDGKLPLGGKWFKVTMQDNSQKKFDANDIFEIPNITIDGVCGIGLLTIARQSISTTLSGDRASNRAMNTGLSVSALITPEDDLTHDITDDIPEIRRQLDRELTGPNKAGGFGLLNRRLKVQPLSITPKDAQFMERQQFQIEEVSRFTGVPPHLLMQTDKQTSWGTGVEEQNRGMAVFVLGPTTKGFEERCSNLLANPRWVEFEFAALLKPSPEKEIELLLKQTGNKPILTVNEARAIRNLPPVPGGNVLIIESALVPDPEEKDEEEVVPDEPNAKDANESE